MTADTLALPGLARTGSGTAVGTAEEAAPPEARVIGLDLSLTGTGMSDGHTTWLISSRGKADDTLASRWARLQKLGRTICDRIPADAALVALEGPAFSKTMGHAHDRSGLWWLVVSALHTAHVPVVEIPPASLKRYATGRGNANKGAMIEATTRRHPHIETGGDDNRCDALWLAALALDHLTGLHVVPETNRDALAKVRWPT